MNANKNKIFFFYLRSFAFSCSFDSGPGMFPPEACGNDGYCNDLSLSKYHSGQWLLLAGSEVSVSC
jgi:hypothetical protein